MNARKLLQMAMPVLGIAQSDNAESNKIESKDFLKTPVFIHHKSDEGGTAFSFMRYGQTFRFQRVGNEIYGPFVDKEWELLSQQYESEELDWIDPLMHIQEFEATKAEKSFYSPTHKSVVKLIESRWYAVINNEVVDVTDAA